MTTIAFSESVFGAGQEDALGAAAGWLTSLVTGGLALTICLMAVALLGLLMFSGRLPVRAGLRTILGCFVLLGAPIIASAFLQFAERNAGSEGQTPPAMISSERAPLPQSTYDPYAGASLRQD